MMLLATLLGCLAGADRPFFTDGEPRSIAVGQSGVAVIYENGEAAKKNLPMPRGRWRALDFGSTTYCGLLDEGEVICWEPETLGKQIVRRLDGDYDAFDAFFGNVCAFGVQEPARCVGTQLGSVLPPSSVIEPEAIATGFNVSCALVAGNVRCWGFEDNGFTFASYERDGSYTDLTFVGRRLCGLDEEGTLDCWPDTTEPLEWPAGRFDALIGAAGTGACVLDDEGYASCFGTAGFELVPPPDDLRFSLLAIAPRRGCGIPVGEGAPVCWGTGLSNAPMPFAVD